ncbi:hypothetical protein GCM10011385_23840 [Nitratireductor aestuarii]|uniref:Uncharacterized protein n=1 Tax=Nitratireductor aestuarii TaxID=1735103 RepID=A0A916RTX4_9HYPH|nr:hypothetical protein GCM10011385_23840 [Nitratireductor aestuarii]
MLRFLPYIIGAVATVLGLGGVWAKAESSGRAKKEAEDAKRREADLARIRRADAARVDGRVQDDPFNRDSK